ncbi:LysR family transcriptional regulator [Paenibacillus thalictri]|uniref:LysR family transcriptional regulator n=1 Tax=Paenibacillus thalictri TaxID=2527873 RepID=A0A4Q9DV05_9BACL|nr:LysR family transcriptional regulator [Paenibacillus thalictri]TBL79418.1 LysR family transcriptional regulator [Paenibacillus thalictri]
MNINKLHTFLTLAECLNFTETADKLYCSQPAVSMQIQSLEDDLGTPLFDRIGKKLFLTSHGKLFKPYAEQMVNLLQQAKEHLKQSESLSTGTLSFGSSNFVGVYLLPAVLSSFNKRYPGIHINMNITSSQQLIYMLETNKLEFLVLSDHIKVDETLFHSSTFYRDELVLIAPSSHPAAGKKDCSVLDFSNETLLLKPQKSATRSFLDTMFSQFGVTFNRFMEISNLEAIKQAVIHGLGISVVSKFAVQHEIASGLLIEIPLRDAAFRRGIQYVHYKNKHLSPAATQFIHMLDNVDAHLISAKTP